MASQRVVCGHCEEHAWLTRCDGCERNIGRDDMQLQLNNNYGHNLPPEMGPINHGQQLTLCGGCASGGVDLLRLLSTPRKQYPDLTR